ncbi:MAG: hypothetical protein ACRED5_06400 [Propylenella sp.]
MILFVTTRGHEPPVRAFAEKQLGAELPEIVVCNYDALFAAREVPRATVIFADIERLYPWEARLAGAMYRALAKAGVRCLNDPARVLTRYALLRALHRHAVNPFDVYRADDAPRPQRFPVLVRTEQDHGRLMGELLYSQAELDRCLERYVADGFPLAGLLVVEFCGEPVAPGIWRKFGTFRIGARYQVERHVTQNNWRVKYGTPGVCPDEFYAFENEVVVQNRVPEAVRRAFEIGCIEYGRADHATVNGVDVVYEINTNPAVIPPREKPTPIRERTLAHAHAALAAALQEVDSGDGAPVELALPEQIEKQLGPFRSGERPRRP